MTTYTPPTERPWEPPFAGTDLEHLLGALDRMRTTFRWKADGLDHAGLQQRVGASTLTIGGLLKHMAANEDFKSLVRLHGAPLDPVWDGNGWEADDDWEFTSAADDTPDRLYDLYDGAVARSRQRFATTIEEGGLDAAAHATGPDGGPVSIRRILLDLLEEYGRHTGHVDLLREAVDGRTGEDPPDGWAPESGSYAFH
ncbi:DUF664 domain-containing protein [Intrasporangium flavum]|uniref:mycothiol transferase n=1 Tax=Intrasporangium flavum TaxID=1428657 RepID=UPI00096FA402|nr:DUF664 domain-containing protein [Intrasporangium flavum]